MIYTAAIGALIINYEALLEKFGSDLQVFLIAEQI